MEFLLEIDYKVPNYSIKRSQVDDHVVIYKTLTNNLVLLIDHKDKGYKNSIDKCKDLDCTQFYTSGIVSGSVAQCGDCLGRMIPPRPSGGEEGCLSGVNLQGLLNSGLPSNIKVTNKDGDSDSSSPNSRGFYNNWKSSSSLNSAAATNAFFIGASPCGPPTKCIVDCTGGKVAGCWDISKYGSSGNGGGTGSFGEIHSIGGNTYQVYDPIQIYMAGLTSNGGTFPFLSGNPLQQGSLVSGFSTVTCGPPNTCFGCPDGGPTDGPPNCHGGGGGGGTCSWTPQPNFLPSSFAPQPVVVEGDYTSGVISTGTQSFDTAGGGAILDSGRYALGGSFTGLPVQSPSSLGIVAVYSSCGDSTGNNIQNNGCGGGPSCKDLARGNVYINGAPSNLGGGSWSSGGATWNNFWPNSNDDDGFRDPANSNLWGGCSGQLTRASSAWSSPCVPEDECSAAGALVSILEIFYDDEGDTGDCCQSTILYGTNCNGESTSACNPGSSGGFEIGAVSNCTAKSRLVAGSNGESCGPKCQPPGPCDPPCQIDYSNGKVDTIGQTYKMVLDSMDPGSCGNDLPWPSPVNHIGCVTKGKLTGLLVGSCGDWPDSCVNGLSNSVSGWIDQRTLNQIKNSGASPGNDVSTIGSNSCCPLKMFSPVFRSDWNIVDCGEEDWVQTRAFSPKCSSC